MNSKYLSIDTEATGLHEGTHLIQLALLPVDSGARKIEHALGIEVLIQCPSFESLKPTLNPWVLEHNEGLIRKAHASGITQEKLIATVKTYMESEAVKTFFGNIRPAFLGKSLSALDIPLLTRYFGKPFMETYFHHHTMDITCVARALVDVGRLPPGTESTTKLLKHLQIRNDANHTALSDATDMADAYFKLLDILRA